MIVLRDLTHTFDNNMPVYPGDAPPDLKQIAFIEKDGYNEYCFHGGMHVGTHIDAPLHMVAGGQRMSDIPVSRFFGRGKLVDARNSTSISAQLLDQIKLEKGDIVVVLTGWSRKFREGDYYTTFPHVDEDFAQLLIDHGVSILALDTPSPDAFPFPIHKLLLGNGVLIIENLADVGTLVGVSEFDIVALPAKFEWEGAPVRVVAKSND